MSPTVLFRVDASSQMGLGHLMRCLALAQAICKARPQSRLFFAMQASSLAYAHSRQDWLGQLEILPDGLGLHEEPAWLDGLCQKLSVSILVLDGYQFDLHYRQQLQAINSLKVIFDDNNNSGKLWADLVINGAGNAAQLGYELTAPNALLCVGANFRILRQEFANNSARLPWAQRQALSVVMGGSDPQNISLRLLQSLQHDCLQWPIILVTGAAYLHQQALQQFLYSSDLQVQHRHNCQTMAEVFAQSRLVVSAAGGSQFELLACCCPALLLVVADNQRNATAEAVKQQWCQAIDVSQHNVDDDVINDIAVKLTELWNNPQLLENMHQCAQQAADWHGASRVVQQLLTLFQDRLGESVTR